jgi:hypothetical protein
VIGRVVNFWLYGLFSRFSCTCVVGFTCNLERPLLFQSYTSLFHNWRRNNKQVYIGHTWRKRNRVSDWLAWLVLLIHSLLVFIFLLEPFPQYTGVPLSVVCFSGSYDPSCVTIKRFNNNKCFQNYHLCLYQSYCFCKEISILIFNYTNCYLLSSFLLSLEPNNLA